MEALEQMITQLAADRLWRLRIEEKETRHLIEAAISLRDWEMHFTLHPSCEEALLRCGLFAHEIPILAKGLVGHEMGHWQVCPFDRDGEYLLMEVITGVVVRKLKGLSAKETDRVCRFLSKLVSDLIVDTVLAWETNGPDYADAQALFMLKEMNLDPSGEGLFRFFTQLNLWLWGAQSRVSSRLLPHLEQETDSALFKKAMKVFPKKALKGHLVSWLRSRANWIDLARKLAAIFIDLLPPPDEMTVWWRPNPFWEVLTVLYEGRTRPIRVAVETEGQVHPETIPLVPLLSVPTDPSVPLAVDDIVWHQTLIQPSPKQAPRLQLYQRRFSIETQVGYAKGSSMLPDLAFCIDSSGSMGFDPHAGKGEYDLLLRAVFGALQFLERNQIALYLRFSVVNFSDETLFSGWRDWGGRERLYQTLFEYQGGRTRLDISQLDRMRQESRGPFALILITDGEIDEWPDVLQHIEKQCQPPKGLILIQIGKESALARRVRKRGFVVHVVKDSHALEGLVLGEVRSQYAN